MKVDRAVERAVRKALAGSVAGEAERFDSAVVAIGDRGDEFLRAALELVFAIDAAAHHFLLALADRRSPLEGRAVADVTFAAFGIGGWLLSAFIPDDAEWTDFLDAILERLEAEPAR